MTNGQATTIGFGPDPDQLFDLSRFYMWPFYSPGRVSFEDRFGVSVLVSFDPSRAREIQTRVEEALRSGNYPHYSLFWWECWSWSLWNVFR